MFWQYRFLKVFFESNMIITEHIQSMSYRYFSTFPGSVHELYTGILFNCIRLSLAFDFAGIIYFFEWYFNTKRNRLSEKLSKRLLCNTCDFISDRLSGITRPDRFAICYDGRLGNLREKYIYVDILSYIKEFPYEHNYINNRRVSPVLKIFIFFSWRFLIQ